MTISIFISNKIDVSGILKDLLVSQFSISEDIAEDIVKERLKESLDALIDDLWFVIESPYVDKVFRDSYYYYFSSKANPISRDCIRISIFSREVQAEDFRDKGKSSKLQENFLGFFIIRPTTPSVLGRSIIAPTALKERNFNICFADISTTVNSIKLISHGFPHSSQDVETMSCAETSLWALMEYFGNKYPEYKPVYPSKITETLNMLSAERLVPSKGLNIPQMSFALRQFGFGSRIYSSEEFAQDFNRIFSCYIESGIPIIAAMTNRHKGGNVGHALLCIGHKVIEDASIDALTASKILNKELADIFSNKKITLFDHDDVIKDFVFIDDNHPAYAIAPLSDPAKNYISYPEWRGCEITFCIVPLYHKVYLEAYEAKNFVLSFITSGIEPIPDGSELYLRMFLTSARSFKDIVAKSDFTSDLKEIIIETAMGRFIWVAELSTKTLIKQRKGNGIIILDATEPNLFNAKPLKIAAYNGSLLTFDEKSKKLKKDKLTLPEFSLYLNNLKGF